ncbi:MAG: DUF1211 domain-containing protein [Erysipelotrichaceae bacterium]|nr:DUF1211 domain-containing protein [Erysipelotrichaceae bacterium]
MTKGRLEAFSDGVIAIIITITVLLIDLPEGNGWGRSFIDTSDSGLLFYEFYFSGHQLGQPPSSFTGGKDR